MTFDISTYIHSHYEVPSPHYRLICSEKSVVSENFPFYGEPGFLFWVITDYMPMNERTLNWHLIWNFVVNSEKNVKKIRSFIFVVYCATPPAHIVEIYVEHTEVDLDNFYRFFRTSSDPILGKWDFF